MLITFMHAHKHYLANYFGCVQIDAQTCVMRQITPPYKTCASFLIANLEPVRAHAGCAILFVHVHEQGRPMLNSEFRFVNNH